MAIDQGAVYTFDLVPEGILLGGDFITRMNEPKGSIQGGIFTTRSILSGQQYQPVKLIGGAFQTNFKGYGGGILKGGSFTTQTTFSGITYYDGKLKGGIFNTNALILGTPVIKATFTGGKFITKATLFGGGILLGGGFTSRFKASATAPAAGQLTGGIFATNAQLLASWLPSGRLKGGIFITRSSAVNARLMGGLFQTDLNMAAVAVAVDGSLNLDWHDSAWVLNADTNESTRYSHYEFRELLAIGGQHYGVRQDGLYLFDNNLETDIIGANPAPINGRMLTKDTDLGVFQSKHLLYVYHNSDSPNQLKITPIHDGVKKLPHLSHYNNRKTHLSRANSSRYVQLKIEQIEQLEGIEMLYCIRQRRVK